MQLDKEVQYATREQELLLKAALLKGADAINAWNEWKGITDLEGHLDPGSFRLLPLLYMNLHQYKVKDPFMIRLKGIYRMAWYENQSLFNYISKILSYLQDAGIQVMLLKGTALTLLNYKNYGVRPMKDIDVLVPTSQVSSTIDLLKKADWRTKSQLTKDDLRYRHSFSFFDNSGMVLDLHWHVLYDSCKSDSDMEFWDGAVPVRFCDVSLCSSNPTDTLLHVIVHGISEHEMLNPEPSIRWIADAMSILNTTNAEIDWVRLVNQAKKHRVCLRLKEGLNYLHDRFQAPIPGSILNDINNSPISLTERLEWRHIMNNQKNMLLGRFPEYLSHYMRLANGTGLLPAISGFPKYLQYRMHARNLRHLFSYLLSRSIRIAKNKILSRRFANSP